MKTDRRAHRHKVQKTARLQNLTKTTSTGGRSETDPTVLEERRLPESTVGERKTQTKPWKRELRIRFAREEEKHTRRCTELDTMVTKRWSGGPRHSFGCGQEDGGTQRHRKTNMQSGIQKRGKILFIVLYVTDLRKLSIYSRLLHPFKEERCFHLGRRDRNVRKTVSFFHGNVTAPTRATFVVSNRRKSFQTCTVWLGPEKSNSNHVNN